MATLQWNVTKGSDLAPTVTVPEGATMNSVSAQMSDADMDRIIAAYRTFGGYDVIQDSNDDGSPKVDDSGHPITRATTDAEVELLIIRGTLNGMLDNAVRVEKEMEAKRAADAVSPIEVTPLAGS